MCPIMSIVSGNTPAPEGADALISRLRQYDLSPIEFVCNLGKDVLREASVGEIKISLRSLNRNSDFGDAKIVVHRGRSGMLLKNHIEKFMSLLLGYPEKWCGLPEKVRRSMCCVLKSRVDLSSREERNFLAMFCSEEEEQSISLIYENLASYWNLGKVPEVTCSTDYVVITLADGRKVKFLAAILDKFGPLQYELDIMIKQDDEWTEAKCLRYETLDDFAVGFLVELGKLSGVDPGKFFDEKH